MFGFVVRGVVYIGRGIPTAARYVWRRGKGLFGFGVSAATVTGSAARSAYSLTSGIAKFTGWIFLGVSAGLSIVGLVRGANFVREIGEDAISFAHAHRYKIYGAGLALAFLLIKNRIKK